MSKTVLRRVEPLESASMKPSPVREITPTIEMVDPRELLINPEYQRTMAASSRRLIRHIVENWSWRKFKPPICARVEEGLEVIDGQTTAISAATHPYIQRIPVLINEVSRVQDRADSFISHNRDRVGITQMQLFHAAVVAGDPTATKVQQVCAQVGVTLLRVPPSKGQYPKKSTVAVRALQRLVQDRGEDGALRVLRILSDAELAPIAASQIKAVDALTFDPEYKIEPRKLTTIVASGGDAVDREAAIFSQTHDVPIWRALVIVYYRRSKRRGA